MDDIVHGGAIASADRHRRDGRVRGPTTRSRTRSTGSTVTLERQLPRGRARAGPDRARGRHPARAEHGLQRGARSPSRRAAWSRPGRSSSGWGRRADDPGRGRGARAEPARRQELLAVPRGIGDIHGAIAGPRVRRARPVGGARARDPRHGLARRLRGRARRALARRARRRRRGPHARRRRAAERDTARRDGDRRAQRPLGDRLEAEGSPLAIPMQVRRVGETVTPHVVVFLHGLGETEYAWGSPNYGDLLDDCARPVFVRFNTGRHISENGASLAALLDELVARLAGRGRADHARSGTRWAGSSPAAPATTAAPGPRHVRARDLARHAAHRRAARAGRARDERGAAPRARRRGRSRASCAAAAPASATCAAARSSTRTGATRTRTRCAPRP